MGKSAWVGLALLIVALTTVDAPGQYRDLLAVCEGEDCAIDQLTPDIERRFRELGVTPSVAVAAGEKVSRNA